MSGTAARAAVRIGRENVDDGVVMNDVGEMSSAVSWSVDVVQSVWCYGVGRAFPECDGDDVFGESGGPCSPAWQVLVVVVVERWPAGVAVVGVGRWRGRLVVAVLAAWEWRWLMAGAGAVCWKNGVWLPHALAVVPRRWGCWAGW